MSRDHELRPPRGGSHSVTSRIVAADVDIVHERAVRAGADVVEEPLDTPYGDRRAMVRDPFGNVCQIEHVIAEP